MKLAEARSLVAIEEKLDPDVKAARAFVKKQRGKSSGTAKARKKVVEAIELLRAVSQLARAAKTRDLHTKDKGLAYRVGMFDHTGMAIHGLKSDVLEWLDAALEDKKPSHFSYREWREILGEAARQVNESGPSARGSYGYIWSWDPDRPDDMDNPEKEYPIRLDLTAEAASDLARGKVPSKLKAALSDRHTQWMLKVSLSESRQQVSEAVLQQHVYDRRTKEEWPAGTKVRVSGRKGHRFMATLPDGSKVPLTANQFV